MATPLSSASNKRQRRHNEERPHPPTQRPQLADIPDALLVRSAEYLSNTSSCVSFAMALTPQNMMSQQPSANNMAIVNASRENWGYINFKDIQDICGRSLTDDDVRWILLAIDAVNNVESLKVTNCIGITGAGLEPLRGSIILRCIDLSLVGDHERQTIDPEPPISVSAVVPILESIIGTEGNSLLRLQLPKKWRMERSSILTQFLQRFARELNRRRVKCSGWGCHETCQLDDATEGRFYGMNSITCYHCLKFFCQSCYEDESLGFCMICEKFYCHMCMKIKTCQADGCLGDPNQYSSCGVCEVMKSW